MNGSNTYQQRNSGVNLAEDLFESYCQSKQYFYQRLGFDEKNGKIPNFFNLNSCMRNLPDYFVNNSQGSKLIMVKGTGNIKKKEYDLLPKFVEWYNSDKCPIYYAFCFKDKSPMLMTISKVISLYNDSTDKQWSDGVIYRNINL